jgi:hypothetical protein
LLHKLTLYIFNKNKIDKKLKENFMKKFNLLVLTGFIVAAPTLFTGCSDKNDNSVGRDKNVPNNVEDNYSRDNDKSTNQ